MNEYLEAKAVLDHMAEDNTCPADADGKWSVREGYYTYYEFVLLFPFVLLNLLSNLYHSYKIHNIIHQNLHRKDRNRNLYWNC